tara:strand:- start:266 stop:511 length:246 start_codon:yes stop_codon:yes gene_type:complete
MSGGILHHGYLILTTHLTWRNLMTKLEHIRNDLDKYIKEELEKSLGDRDFEVFSFEEKLYEIIDSLDEIIHFDPTLNKEKN